MDMLDRLLMKARSKANPPMKAWERIMHKNPYIDKSRDELINLLASPQDDWRSIAQACAWKGGG